MATSREPLRIAGESEFDLPPMDESDAVALFIERAQAVRADVGDSPAVHELIRRLDGLPLAIELAAARVKLLGPEQLLERIAQRLDLLKGGRDADERHATLRATIAWSYDLLDDDEQQLFARLAVFRGGCTLDAAEAVCDADLDTLASLLDKSLVRRRTDANGDERFWMLETIREFARERLEASGEEDALRQLQTDWLLELADRAGTRANCRRPRQVGRSTSSRPRSTTCAPCSTGLPSTTPSVASPWPRRSRASGSFVSRSKARHGSSPCSHEPRTPSRSFAPTRCGPSAVRSSSPANPNVRRPATSRASSSSSRAETRSRRRTSATASLETWWIRGETAAAWPLLEESLRTFRQLGLPRGEAQVLGYLAEKAYGDGDLALAIERSLESAAIAHELGWDVVGGRPAPGGRHVRARARHSRCCGGSCPQIARALSGPR